jgi:hypothetical protein
MALNIGERLLKNSEKYEFQIPGQAFGLFGDVRRYFNSRALGIPFDKPFGCRSEPEFVQQRRMQ